MPISDGYMMLDNPHAGFAVIPVDKLEEWKAWLKLAHEGPSEDENHKILQNPPDWAETLDYGMLSHAVSIPSYELATADRVGPPTPDGYAIVGNDPDTDVFIIPAGHLGEWRKRYGYGDSSDRELLREESDPPEWGYNVSRRTSDWVIYFPHYEME
jgi:hypothetical protein